MNPDYLALPQDVASLILSKDFKPVAEAMGWKCRFIYQGSKEQCNAPATYQYKDSRWEAHDRHLCQKHFTLIFPPPEVKPEIKPQGPLLEPRVKITNPIPYVDDHYEETYYRNYHYQWGDDGY